MSFIRKIMLASAFGLAAVMLLSIAAVYAETDLFEKKAVQLKEIGLFRGSDQGFELDRQPNRLEALVMLIRLLGKEEEALGNASQSATAQAAHPFVDVPGWAAPYVEYAYRHQLTNGVSRDRFGSDQDVNASQYFTFVLRALGYRDDQGDFVWQEAGNAARALGIVTDGYYGEQSRTFLRAHLVDISYAALYAPMKGGSQMLLDKLIEDGAVQSATAEQQGLINSEGEAEPVDAGYRDGDKLIVPVTYQRSVSDEPLHTVPAGTLKRHLPELYGSHVYSTTKLAQLQLAEGIDLEQYIGLIIAETSHSPNLNVSPHEEEIGLIRRSSFDDIYILFDENRRAIAYTTSEDFDAERMEYTFHLRPERIVQPIIDEATALAAGALKFSHDAVTYYDYMALTMLQDGSILEEPAKMMVIDREKLPGSAQAFIRISGIYFNPAPEDESSLLLMSRFNRLRSQYLGWQNHQMVYSDEIGAVFMSEKSANDKGLSMFFLEDEDGRILGYIAYTREQKQAVFGQ